MESFLWAINLCAVVFLCFWAIKADDEEVEKNKAAQDLKDNENLR
ncbi:hypothetical protein [Colwellia psychrerythraea]|jgi:hypothetical protein|uniref:Uncharacterized protein n=1 Tax=Colwellia psychrerythraea TaxID=28229 RepID=A0A099KYI4_COLPS|nr:hypothetical protein [Colwellia psychrerythraea]KGJ94708.1 hypothetical protein ND2E_1897 [Colwellia psychrerythraea]